MDIRKIRDAYMSTRVRSFRANLTIYHCAIISIDGLEFRTRTPTDNVGVEVLNRFINDIMTAQEAGKRNHMRVTKKECDKAMETLTGIVKEYDEKTKTVVTKHVTGVVNIN